MSENFFEQSKEHSQIKTEIISKYFWVWAKVITSTQKKSSKHINEKIGYIDLFAGPGRYKDNSESTPIQILKRAIADETIRKRLVTIFNDKNKDFYKNLIEEINKIDGIHSLEYKPKIYCDEVGDQMVELFEEKKLPPTLSFIDPWGYKGLSLRLVNSLIKDWGCDCIFFFNYNRINMGLSNDLVESHMDELFGKENADKIREKLSITTIPEDRELLIVNELIESFLQYGKRYILPFRFRDARGKRTTHHLIFISKSVKGYEIMKGIMAKYSTISDQGVPSFEYNPADKRYPKLFEFTRPLEDLAEMLLYDFRGNTLKMIEIYERHHPWKPFIKKNYKDVLKNLENQGKIVANPPSNQRKKNTFSEDVSVTFPK